MDSTKRLFGVLFWVFTAALFAGAVVLAFAFTPDEATMGAVQKIFYVHLPVAINSFLACFVNFVASLVFLWQRRRTWDDLATAAAQVAVVLLTIVLATGMIWGRSAWGHWWTWSPRLTLSLVLWLLYVVYLVIRPSIPSAQRRAVVAAVYGAVAFLDVPLVYLSTRLMPQDVHPTEVVLAPSMRLTLGLWFLPVTLLTVGLIIVRRRALALQSQTRAVLAAAENDGPVPATIHPTGGVL